MLPFATLDESEGVTLGEMSQMERSKIMWFNVDYKRNRKLKLTHRYRQQNADYQRVGEGDG